MIFGSVCSGIEAASVAWAPLGWKPAFFSEIEKFPSKVLKHHYPDVPNLGDMNNFKEWPEYAIRLLCGGTPCQSFSIAGLRKGLDDSRGNLMLTFGQIAARYRPDWLVWENVPGVLSSNGGKDFAAFLGLLSGQKITVPKNGWGTAGIIPGYKNAYGLAYRVFDAQYFGVAQRRRRVFVVGYIGNWRPPFAVLFEREGLQGNPAPRREPGKRIAPCVTGGPPFSRTGNERVEAEALVVQGSHWDGGPHPALSQSHIPGAIGYSNQELFSQRGAGLVPVPETVGALCADSHPGAYSGQDAYTGRLVPIALSAKDYGNGAAEDLCPTLRAMGHGDSHANGGGQMAVAFKPSHYTRGKDGGPSEICPTLTREADKGDNDPVIACFKAGQSAQAHGIGYEEEMAPTLEGGGGGNNKPALLAGMAVRRLTPRECERLQGFPDDYTLIGEKCPDGPRYKALGNSWAVPNVRWIGERIQMMDEILRGNNEQAIEKTV